MKLAKALFLSLLMAGAAHAQDAGLNPDLPKLGTPAPALTFTQLLQAPAGTSPDRPALQGKVVVLEFWATWCVPCVAEIPIVNSLVASLDPAKVQFIAVSNEDPATVEAFLKSKPIASWIGLDATNKLSERYGVKELPTTIVIGPDGHVASTTVRPESLKREQLLALSEGKPVVLGGAVDPNVRAELTAAMAKAAAEHIPVGRDPVKQVFDIRLRIAATAKDGYGANTYIYSMGPDEFEIANASPETLVQFGMNLPSTRISVSGDLPEGLYTLRVKAPHANARQLASAIELAIVSGAGVHIEHRVHVKQAYVLTAKPEAKDHFSPAPFTGKARYDPKTLRLECVNITADQLAATLERSLGAPVVNETGLAGKVAINPQIDPKDFASARAALGKRLGLTLVSAKRPIETVVLSPVPAAVEKPAPQPK